MNLEEIKEQPIKHIFMYSIPAIIAMLLSSFVTIVDGIFISKNVGKEALAAINLGLPMLFVFLAVCIMIGSGAVSLAGRRLGAKENDSSINLFNQTLVVSTIAFIIMSTIFFIGFRPIISSIKLNSITQKNMLDYYNVMLWIYPLMMINIIFGMFIRCEGKPHLFMINTIISTIFNVILDYILIVKLNLGVRGAAYASGVAILVGTLLMVKYFISSKTFFKFRKFEFVFSDLKESLINGSSELIGQLSISITTLFLNAVVLKKMGLVGVAAMTLVGYTQYIYNMMVVGFGQGVSPMLSYSYGAKEYNLGVRLRYNTNRIVVILGILFFGVLNVWSFTYAKIFTTDTELISIVVGGLKIFSFVFLVTGFNAISSFYFTAIGYAKQSAIISSLRGLVLLSLNILVLPILFGNSGIWMIAPVTEILTCVVVIYLLKKSNFNIQNQVPSSL